MNILHMKYVVGIFEYLPRAYDNGLLMRGF